MTDLTPGGTVQIDRSTRILPPEEEEAVNDILRDQMPGYTVAPNAVWEEPVEDVPLRDFSPPLAALKAHFDGMVRTDVTPSEIPPEARALVDREADLRMYRVRHDDWSDDVPPITVLISMSGKGTVVASA